MKRRVLFGIVAVTGALSALALAPAAHATSVPPACVVVHGPNGLSLQVGYSPTGPSGCGQVP
ncbi:MAG TPA: hypothetical protein VG435_06790 [Acidimicrobiales bacterium]|nr:hypothetical protein [Acidimicrobiales bacterium]